MSFTRVTVPAPAGATQLTLPAGPPPNQSALYLIAPTVTGNTAVTIQLPPAALGVNRLLTIRLGNTNGRVTLQPAPGDPAVIGWDNPTLRLQSLRDYVTLASDGTAWFVAGGNVQ